MWKSHFIIALVLILLTLPMYFLDQYLLQPKSGNWISLDFRGVLAWGYLIFLALHFTFSSLAIYFFPKWGLGAIHGLSALTTIILLALGIWIFT